MGNFISHRAVEDGHHESSFLDFKLQSYSDSKEWLKDVTAFANSRGGRIILGIEEDEHGQAAKLVGLEVEKLDQEIQRLSNWLREHSEPDVSGAVKITPEIDDAGRKFLIVDVTESELGPHRLKIEFQKFNRQVYVRKSRDCVPVSMMEIRDMILDTQRTPRLISEFLADRKSELAQETPLGRREIRYISFHICPHQGFGSRNLVDWAIQHAKEISWSPEFEWTSIRPNALGAITNQSTLNARDHGSYCQIFYNSCTELLFNDAEDPYSGIDADIIWTHINRDLKHVLKRMHRATACENFSVHCRIVGFSGQTLHCYRAGGGGFRKIQAANIPNRIELPVINLSIDHTKEPSQEEIQELARLFSRVWEREHLIGPR